MLAAIQYRVDMARALLIAGAKPNAQANDGSTALMRAIDQNREVGQDGGLDGKSWGCQGSKEMVQLLLKYGADPRIKDNSGKTALDWTRKPDCRERIGPPRNRRWETSGPGPGAIVALLRQKRGKKR
jgi:ankyrin repeat protein